MIRTNALKTNDISNKISANDHKALLGKVPSIVSPIPEVNWLVSVDAGEIKFLGMMAALPMTIWTAKASPKARAIPKITAVKIPGVADRRITRETVCQRVAPSASDASL